MSLQSDLIAAKALIDTPDKWYRGGWEASGCYCALGAVNKVATGDAQNLTNERLERALERAIPSDFTVSRWSRIVTAYNDHSSTTHADIMALFDRAIAAAA